MVQGLTRKRFALRDQDPPRAGRRRLRGRHRDRALRRQARARARRGRARAGSPSPEPVARARCSPRTPRALARAPVRAAAPGRAARSSTRAARCTQVTEAAEALGEVGWNFANPAPKVPLNVEIGSHRRFEWVRGDLAQFKRIKDALGGTVNDVVLAVVSRRAAQLAARRAASGPRALELRAQVPVSIRAEDERGQLGNQIAAVRGADPGLRRGPGEAARASAARAWRAIKESKQALGAEVISRFNDFAPPTLLAQAARVNFSTRLFNLVVTNVPGPQIPLYVLGPRARGHLPGRLPAARTGAVRRDHELQRRHQLRPARRLRRDRRRRRSRAGSRRRSPSCSRRRRRRTGDAGSRAGPRVSA